MRPKQQRGHPASGQRPPRFVEDDEMDSVDDALADGAQGPAGHVVERPDGYHWVSEDGRHEFGPFASLAEALADMDGFGEARSAADLQEAEDALGLNDWDDDLGGVGDLRGAIDDD
jgi:hypothetical protein